MGLSLGLGGRIWNLGFRQDVQEIHLTAQDVEDDRFSGRSGRPLGKESPALSTSTNFSGNNEEAFLG